MLNRSTSSSAKTPVHRVRRRAVRARRRAALCADGRADAEAVGHQVGFRAGAEIGRAAAGLDARVESQADIGVAASRDRDDALICEQDARGGEFGP